MPVSLASSDLNSDGHADLVVGCVYSDNIAILYGRAGGVFVDGAHYGTGPGTTAVAVGDFDRNGNADIAVTGLAASPSMPSPCKVSILSW